MAPQALSGHTESMTFRTDLIARLLATSAAALVLTGISATSAAAWTIMGDREATKVISFGGSCARCELSGRKLIGATFQGANFEGATLVGADLRGAQLIGSNFSSSDFSRADLRNAQLTGSMFTLVNFTGEIGRAHV